MTVKLDKLIESRVHSVYSKNVPKGAVDITRDTIYGNPYIIHIHGNRDEVCDLFEKNVLPNLDISKLKYKHLVCHCSPKRCHGHSIIKKLIEQETLFL